MIYQETLKLLKKASDPYTIDEPKGWSPSNIATRYWLHNDPKIVDQRNRLNTLRTNDNRARQRGALIRDNIQTEGRLAALDYGKTTGSLSPAQGYNIRDNYIKRTSNNFDQSMRDTYHLGQATGGGAIP